ncbi:MAG: ABC transporter permease [Ilumatobacteraceae bacterium]
MSTSSESVKVLSSEQRKRARNVGFAYVVLGLVSAVIFTNRPGNAGFKLQDDYLLVVPARPFASALAIVLVALGAAQLLRGLGRWTNVVLTVATISFVVGFLTWAASGGSFSLTGMLQDTVARSVPITLGAIAGILCERSGIINIAIEGQLLGSAFAGSVVGSILGAWPGIGAAILMGVALSGILAVFSIKYRVDQVIVGFAINFFALGLTSFLTSRILTPYPQYNSLVPFKPYKIPLLSKIPVIGTILFTQTLFVYASFAVVAVTTWALFRTRWGLRTRAIGEYPKAAGTLGVDVIKLRYRNVLVAGAVAGLGGAWWPVGTVGRFDQNITGGRGFIALAAVIFGRWHPVGALSAALVFGFSEAIQLKLSNLKTGIPSEFLLMSPYLVTLIVVAGFVGRSRAPKASGQPYDAQ